MSQPIVIIFLLLLVLLMWQGWRSRLSWRWRWLWLPVVLGIGGAVSPPNLLPLNLSREQQELVLLTPGDGNSAHTAQQWALATDAALVSMSARPDASQLQQLQIQIAADGGKRLQLFGYGFDEAVWQQLPRHMAIWHAPEMPVWQLQAPESLPLGDALVLTLRAPAPAQQLQLLDSRQQLQVESLFTAGSSTLAFRPAASGHYDWQLRVRDAAGVVLRDIPLAFAVTAPAARALAGQFSAPSFEQRALREWWQLTGWQGEFVTRTGQSVQRRDRFNLASHAAFEPQLQLRDVRSWLQASNAERRQLLNHVAAGQTLLLLSDGSEAELRARTILQQQLGLDWQALTESEQLLSVADVALQRAGWLPRAQGPWQQSVDRAVLQRSWQQGRIVWMGVINSHRLWQKSRSAYADWWQQALQLTAQAGARWHSPGPGVVAQPSLLCIDDLGIDDLGVDDLANADPAVAEPDGVGLGSASAPSAAQTGQPRATAENVQRPVLLLQTSAGERLPLPLQAASTPGQACALYTPRQSGWYQVLAPVTASWRVQASPPLAESLWQQAYAATRRHSQELAPPLPLSQQPLPRWPFLLLSLLALAGIWWRERQLQSS